MSVILTFVFMLLLTVGKEQQSSFPIIGYFDDFNPSTLIAHGWAFQNNSVNNGETAINITIMLNQSITLVTTVANGYRPDLVAAHVTPDPYHGFTVNLSDYKTRYFSNGINSRLDVFGISAINSSYIETLSNSPRYSDPLSYNIKFPSQLQGIDDESYVNYLYNLNEFNTIDTRYKKINADINPGLLRYNMFWSNFEPNPSIVPNSTTNISGIKCADGYTLIPDNNEKDRIKRGYNHYHCYSTSAIDMFNYIYNKEEDVNTINTSVNAAILYASPEWVRYSNCTGFPWDNTMYKYGCVPRDDERTMLDWMDYCNFVSETWNGSDTGNTFKISYFIIWNEVGSGGWFDYSPILPNRYDSSNPINATQIEQWQKKVASLMSYCRAGLRQRNRRGMNILVSTDHFWDAPAQNNGDVISIGEKVIIDGLWNIFGTSIDWSVAVHPYDDGNPKDNLWDCCSIYTFATLNNIVTYQQNNLLNLENIAANGWDIRPQTYLYASEQGWAFNNVSMNDTLRARNICFAQELSMQLYPNNMIGVTHNYFHAGPNDGSQNGQTFGLIPVTIYANLSNADGYETYEAHKSTNSKIWNQNNDHYCCIKWQSGCQSA